MAVVLPPHSRRDGDNCRTNAREGWRGNTGRVDRQGEGHGRRGFFVGLAVSFILLKLARVNHLAVIAVAKPSCVPVSIPLHQDHPVEEQAVRLFGIAVGILRPGEFCGNVDFPLLIGIQRVIERKQVFLHLPGRGKVDVSPFAQRKTRPLVPMVSFPRNILGLNTDRPPSGSGGLLTVRQKPMGMGISFPLVWDGAIAARPIAASGSGTTIGKFGRPDQWRREIDDAVGRQGSELPGQRRVFDPRAHLRHVMPNDIDRRLPGLAALDVGPGRSLPNK